jgi:hypothetical protein
VSVCECERSSAATLGQVLLLANSDEIESKIADSNGRVAKLLKAKTAAPAIIEELYLTAFSRHPTAPELNRTREYIETASDKQKAVEDVLWAVLNSKEFMFNH